MEAVTIMPTQEWEDVKKSIKNLEKLIVNLIKNSSKVDKIYTLHQAAELMNKSYMWVFQNKHQIGASRSGRHWNITQNAIDNYLKSTYHKNN